MDVLPIASVSGRFVLVERAKPSTSVDFILQWSRMLIRLSMAASIRRRRFALAWCRRVIAAQRASPPGVAIYGPAFNMIRRMRIVPKIRPPTAIVCSTIWRAPPAKALRMKRELTEQGFGGT